AAGNYERSCLIIEAGVRRRDPQLLQMLEQRLLAKPECRGQHQLYAVNGMLLQGGYRAVRHQQIRGKNSGISPVLERHMRGQLVANAHVQVFVRSRRAGWYAYV